MPSASRKIGRQCAAVSLTRRRRSRADVRVSPPLLSSSPLSSRLLSSPPCAPPLLDAAPLFEMPIGFSTAAARVSSTLLPPLVDAAPHRVAPLVATTPLVTTTPLSPHSPPLHLSSPRCRTSSTSFLSSPLHLSSPRCHASSPPLPLLIRPRLRPRHSYRCICTRAFRRFAAVLCVCSENDA